MRPTSLAKLLIANPADTAMGQRCFRTALAGWRLTPVRPGMQLQTYEHANPHRANPEGKLECDVEGKEQRTSHSS